MKKAVEVKDEVLSIDLILDLHHIATSDAIENHQFRVKLDKMTTSLFQIYITKSFTNCHPGKVSNID
jgi:hypothetical protein